jgi:hypothetical protein
MWRIDWERSPDPSTPPIDPPPRPQKSRSLPHFLFSSIQTPVVAERLGVDHALGEGDMLRHRKGTVVLNLTGTTKSIVLRPVPNAKDTNISCGLPQICAELFVSDARVPGELLALEARSRIRSDSRRLKTLRQVRRF